MLKILSNLYLVKMYYYTKRALMLLNSKIKSVSLEIKHCTVYIYSTGHKYCNKKLCSRPLDFHFG